MKAEQKRALAEAVTIDDFLAVCPSISRQQIFLFLELGRDIAIDELTRALSSNRSRRATPEMTVCDHGFEQQRDLRSHS